jgi:hypothetical protein
MNTDNIKQMAATPWWYFLLGDLLGLIVLGCYWFNSSLPFTHFFVSALLLLLATTLAAAPLIRFVIFDWEARLHEFVNRLNNEALIAYLQQFWEKRTTQDSTFVGWNQEGKIINGTAIATTTDEVNKSMEKIFDAIYREQYGRNAFIAPLILLNSSIFMLSVLCIFVYLEHVTLGLGIDPKIAIASLVGAYMYVVSDTVQSVRQRCLNASNIYWYVLRILLAIPVGVALTLPIPEDTRPIVAFALGTIPMDQIIKMLRSFVDEKLNLSKKEEKTDQLVRLEGVTSRIASMLIAEGVDSIEQIITVDPVLLSIRTGLPFKFILHLGSQAIVRRHFGESAEKLIPLGIADARSISALVTDLDKAEGTDEQKRAKAVLTAATSLLMPANSDYSPESLEFNFRLITNGNYTKFILGKSLNV